MKKGTGETTGQYRAIPLGQIGGDGGIRPRLPTGPVDGQLTGRSRRPEALLEKHNLPVRLTEPRWRRPLRRQVVSRADGTLDHAGAWARIRHGIPSA